MSSRDLTALIRNVHDSVFPVREDLIELLSLKEESYTAQLFSFADKVRKDHIGGGVLLRGIIEFSNFCNNSCMYCGINSTNRKIKRYLLFEEELLERIYKMASYGVKTVVLQSGEDRDLDPVWLSSLIVEIKNNFDMAVTLSVGEKSYDEYKMWKEAGADRYLLKIETTNRELYERLHPGMSYDNRVACLKNLKKLNYQVGSGNIIGLPGQTVEMIAEDILFFKENDFDMIGIGPFIPHKDTLLYDKPVGRVDLALKVLAIVRIVTKNSHLPSTTALGVMGDGAQKKGLLSGANVIMPNFTPESVNSFYQIYEREAFYKNSLEEAMEEVEKTVTSIKRYIDRSRGDSLKKGGKTSHVPDSCK